MYVNWVGKKKTQIWLLCPQRSNTSKQLKRNHSSRSFAGHVLNQPTVAAPIELRLVDTHHRARWQEARSILQMVDQPKRSVCPKSWCFSSSFTESRAKKNAKKMLHHLMFQKSYYIITSILICLEHPNWSGFCLATVGHQHHRHQNVCLVEERCGQRIAPIKIPSANQPQQNQAESKGPCSFKVAAPTIQLQSIGQRDTQTSSVLGISLPTTNQPRVLNVNEHIKLWSSSSYHIIKPLLCFSDL